MTKQCYFCSYPNSDTTTLCINCGQELGKYWQKNDGKSELVDENRN